MFSSRVLWIYEHQSVVTISALSRCILYKHLSHCLFLSFSFPLLFVSRPFALLCRTLRALGPARLDSLTEFERSRESESAPLLPPSDLFLSSSLASFFLVPFLRVSTRFSHVTRPLHARCRCTAFRSLEPKKPRHVDLAFQQYMRERCALFLTLLLQLSFLMILQS